MTNRDDAAGHRPEDDGAVDRARAILADAIELERAGRSRRAERVLAEAAVWGRQAGNGSIESEALRRLAVIRHHAGDAAGARRHAAAALIAARSAADPTAEAHCLNVQGGVALELGDLDEARTLFEAARRLARSDGLLARIEQNLGIIANVAGDRATALEHYGGALQAFRRAGDEQGAAISLHNLAILSAGRGAFELAEEYLDQALRGARQVGDLRLEGLCGLSRAEVYLATDRVDAAWDEVEKARAVFSQLGSLIEESEVYRLFGAVFRHQGREAMAEANLIAACEHARVTGAVLTEAESFRELARLRLDQGRTAEAVDAYQRAGALFDRTGALGDRAAVDSCLAAIP